MILSDPDNSSGISAGELDILQDLLLRIKNTQITGGIWHALIQKFPTVALELVVLDSRDRALLIYREDDEFVGWHLPGSVWNDWETIPERRQKLVSNEITRDVGIQIIEPKSIGWMGIYRGNGLGNNRSRNTCALIQLTRFSGQFLQKDKVDFFPLSSLPENILGNHKYILQRVEQYLVDGVSLSD